MALQRLTSEADTMLVAPLRFQDVLLEEMDRQIALAMQGKPASIILKTTPSTTRRSSTRSARPAVRVSVWT